MIIRDLIWLEEIIEKLEQKHNVSLHEVTEVFESNPYFRFISKGRRHQKEDVYAAYGRTAAGRYLSVFFMYKQDQRALIISARDMDDKERKRYVKKGS